MTAPIDRLRRDRVIALMRTFAAGKLTNDEFEDRYDVILGGQAGSKLEDRALWAIRSSIHVFWNDLKTHRLEGSDALNPEGKRSFARWILFLRSNLPYDWKSTRFPLFSFTLQEAVFGLLTLGQWNRRKKKEDRASDIWPFRRLEDLEKAKLGPR